MPSLLAVECNAQGTCVAVGSRGTVLVSRDGLTWNTIPTPSSEPTFFDVKWTGNQFLMVGGPDMWILSLGANASAVEVVQGRDDREGVRLKGVDTGMGYCCAVVMEGGHILRAPLEEDGSCLQWELMTSVHNSYYFNVRFLEDEFIAMGADPFFYRSKDCGAVWDIVVPSTSHLGGWFDMVSADSSYYAGRGSDLEFSSDLLQWSVLIRVPDDPDHTSPSGTPISGSPNNVGGVHYSTSLRRILACATDGTVHFTQPMDYFGFPPDTFDHVLVTPEEGDRVRLHSITSTIFPGRGAAAVTVGWDSRIFVAFDSDNLSTWTEVTPPFVEE
eukprot:TRINITY_DN37431_c0_g1_i1.p1 TRINITY_DN37431_c0_g1~~TRINITY_DN37431_c0_g1_i1.p1  ORF type:complete len:353 (+),score=64.94 TRINITY_DN37431_c0_g1_i1:75-1061(+)